MRRATAPAPRFAALLACALLPFGARAAVEGPGKELSIHAARAQGRIHADGKLDEASWAAAPVFDAFVERFPVAGARPQQRTELRVLYDDRYLYVGIFCRDTEPSKILRRLGRRDASFTADGLQVIIDPKHDHRTAYAFWITASGVQGDGIFFDDRFYSGDWDAVWEGAAGTLPDGWVAELAIPLSALHFPEAKVQTWGFDLERYVVRLDEEIGTFDKPHGTGAVVSRFGHLTGMEDLHPHHAVELSPYVAARGIFRPQYSDAAIPQPRLLDPSADVGLDLQTPISSGLTLNATLNPDFGQVEADQVIQNLSTFEAFFPEKRPFFNQGMELFQPVGGSNGANQRLFYSRRVGLDAPIFGAGKVTGTVAKGVDVGVLDAIVMGPSQGLIDEARPDRRLGLHLERPFHLGLRDELPSVSPAPTNYLAAVTRATVGANSTIGGIVTSAVPLELGCALTQSQLDNGDYGGAALPPASCLARGGNAAAFTFDLRTNDSSWGVLGQVAGSQEVGGPSERILADGTRLRPGALGAGGFIRAGRLGGDGWGGQIGYDFTQPTLDLNASGYLRSQNEHVLRASLQYSRPNGWGALKSFWFGLSGRTNFSSDGRGIWRGGGLDLNVNMALPSLDWVGVDLGFDPGAYDIREILGAGGEGTGIPLQRPPAGFLVFFFDTNDNRPLRAGGELALGYHQLPFSSEHLGWGAHLRVSYHPLDALETTLELADDRTLHGPRFADCCYGGSFIFGNLESQYLSVTFRQQVMLTAKLSLQAYAQLFTGYGVYGPLFSATSDANRSAIRFSDLQPTSYPDDPDFYSTQLNVNVVLRWEYALGSTLYLVYTHSQAGRPFDAFQQPKTLLPQGLLQGPANDAVLLKWSWYASL